MNVAAHLRPITHKNEYWDWNAATADGRLYRAPRGQAADASADGADRARRAAADLHGVARPDHPGDGAADDRARLRQRARSTLADHGLSAGVDRDHPALRQDRRHPRTPLHAADRDPDLYGGLARLRARAEHAGADIGPRAARARRRRALLDGHDRARRPGLAQGARALLRLFLRHLLHRRRHGTPARRVDRRPSALVGDLLDEHSDGARGARDHDSAAAGAAALRAAAPIG